MKKMRACPVCGLVPKLGYCCGEYFVYGTGVQNCAGCGTMGFLTMHSSPDQEIEEWNRWCEEYAENH